MRWSTQWKGDARKVDFTVGNFMLKNYVSTNKKSHETKNLMIESAEVGT